MVRIAPINLYYNPKTLWFDAGDLDVRAGDGVIVSTARGTEFGRAAHDVFEADEAQIKKLKSPLKPVKRIATDEDEARAAELEAKSREALPVFKEMAAEGNGDMHPVSVEYLFEGDKAIFYFEAEERVDFRELVRKLAAHFRVRIDMRQIGVRDEARMVGGLGHCGQELCCKRLGGEFCPVSIRMAKEQDLSLNPQKISGVCGRLMCCLRYEFDAYKDFKSRAPKKNAMVGTPDGPAKVADLDVPREMVSLKTEEGQVVKVPLASFEPPEQGSRPNEVGEDAWRQACEPVAGASSASMLFSGQSLSGTDKLAEPGAVRLTGGKADRSSKRGGASKRRGSGKQDSSAQAEDRRKPRRRSRLSSGSDVPAASEGPSRKKGGSSAKQSGSSKRSGQDKHAAGQKPRRRSRSQEPQGTQGTQGTGKQGASQLRPGRKSSALRQPHEEGGKRQRQAGASSDARRKDPSSAAPSEGSGRRPRRRSHKAHGGHDAQA